MSKKLVLRRTYADFLKEQGSDDVLKEQNSESDISEFNDGVPGVSLITPQMCAFSYLDLDKKENVSSSKLNGSEHLS